VVITKNLRVSASSAGNKYMTENEISYKIRGAIFKVYKTFGPGLLESVYVAALLIELKKQGLSVEKEVPIPVFYEGEQLEVGFRIDILVNKLVIIEVKSVENLAEVHHKQVLTYLKLTNLKLAILANFNVVDIEKGITRKVNNL
jgi:GxxExxY protein